MSALQGVVGLLEDPRVRKSRVREALVALTWCMGSFGQSRGVFVLDHPVDTAEVHVGDG